MTGLLLVPILVAAVGTDLGLALLVLGLLFTWNAAPPELVALDGLATPWVLAVAAAAWVAETVLEQTSITLTALWHTVQVVARPVSALLLAVAVAGNAGVARGGVTAGGGDAAVGGGDGMVVLAVAGVAALAALAVHAGAVGWLAFLHLGSVPRRARWVAAFAEDAAVVALLALGLDHPVPALALLVALAVAAPRHHLTSLAGFQLLIRGVVGDARRLLAPGGWWPLAQLPGWVGRRLEAAAHQAVGEWRGTPAGLQGPDASRLRYGWLVVGRGTRRFVPRVGAAVDLGGELDPGAALDLDGDSPTRVREDRIFTRVHLGERFTLFVTPDGPGAPELEIEFGVRDRAG